MPALNHGKEVEALNNNVVILIDSFTKTTVTSITYDDIAKHAAIITDVKELSDSYMECNLVIFETAIPLIVTPECLEELIDTLKIKVFLVYQKEEIIAAIKKYCTAVKADYSNVSWPFVYAVVNGDYAILQPFQESQYILDSFTSVRAKLPVDLREYFERFRGTYMNLAASVNALLDRISRLQEVADIQEKIGAQTISGLKELKKLLDQSQDKCNTYEALLSKSYDTVKNGFFPDRPRILYIKEISHLAGIDIFISVIFSVLTQQYKSSVKVIALVDASSALKLQFIPNYYIPLSDSYNTAELLQSDFVMKLGGYSLMFDTLLLNRSGLEYLIIHDCRSTPHSALDQSLIDLRINEMTQDYSAFGAYDNVLSDGGRHTSFMWIYKEIRKYSGSKSIRLSNHPTIRTILDLII